MKSSTLSFNKDALLDLLRDFYILTGIQIVIYDIEGNGLVGWPGVRCPFCSLMYQNPITAEKCEKSNKKSFRKCLATGQLNIYKCHAGLVEATAPLIDNGLVIGYVMFGQISDLSTKADLKEHLTSVLNNYNIPLPEDASEQAAIYQVSRKTPDQIRAAGKILEACTFYVFLKEIVQMQRQNFMHNMNEFLMAHLSEDLSVARLMSEFHISRNKLYEASERYLGVGIASYIKTLRITEAKRLLKETTLTVSEISARIGFTDYNYFHRVFKAQTGISANKFRKLYQEADSK